MTKFRKCSRELTGHAAARYELVVPLEALASAVLGRAEAWGLRFHDGASLAFAHGLVAVAASAQARARDPSGSAVETKS